MEYCLEPRYRIGGRDCVIDEMFVAEFSKEHLCNRLISRRREMDVQQSVRVGSNRCVQPVPFVVELDHGLVNRNVIRIRTVEGL